MIFLYPSSNVRTATLGLEWVCARGRKGIANVMAKDAATAAVIRRRQSSRKLSEREAYSWS